MTIMNIQYQDKIVAFLDVLGFKNLIYSNNTDTINDYFEFLITKFKVAIKEKEIDYLMISDSIVIYGNANKEYLNEIIQLISVLQTGLLTQGVILRGAISRGDLFVDKSNNIIVGKGLAAAYQLESTVAEFPRVIIDRSLLGDFYDCLGDITESLKTAKDIPLVTFRTFDSNLRGFPYINYGGIIAQQRSIKNLEYIVGFLKENLFRNSNVEKYEWLKSHLIVSANEVYFSLKDRDDLTRQDKERVKYAKRFIEKLERI
jgi:hypothetical protein